MPQVHKKDEIKRKLRELKKLEIQVRSNSFDMHKNSNNFPIGFQNTELVWTKYFDLKDEFSKNVKYSVIKLSLMTKDEFKDVINTYLGHIYYCYYKEFGIIMDNSLIESDFLTQLGLPIYTDRTEIKRKLRELAKEYHPDNGGNSARFIELMEKYKRFKS